MKKIFIVFGTRPEAIKLAPLILAMNTHPKFKVIVCVTGQHRAMLDQILTTFNITPDYDLNLMKPNQNLSSLTASLLQELAPILDKEKPELLVVQGDTTTSFAAALSAFYHHIPIAHVEAGLRTHTIQSPFPEEFNRQTTSKLATYHFAPTPTEKQNLIHEGISEDHILVCGNTVIDALFLGLQKGKESAVSLPISAVDSPIILVTCHRRESFGEGLKHICEALHQLATTHPDYTIVFPVHPNPNVSSPVHQRLEHIPNIQLIAPLDYIPFIALMSKAKLILTDSGGIQEEAPSLNIPVLVMRDSTERKDAITAGVAKLVGTKTKEIVSAANELIATTQLYTYMSNQPNPYGNGSASKQIIEFLEKHL